jgi:DNA-directed RNA polymerase subunit omega
MQKQVEVDEPEASEAPLMITASETPAAAPAQEEDVAEMDRMTEEDLLRGLEGLPPAESPGSQRSGY